MMGLRDLLADHTLSDVLLDNMTLDSREVQPNMIFVAVPGQNATAEILSIPL